MPVSALRRCLAHGYAFLAVALLTVSCADDAVLPTDGSSSTGSSSSIATAGLDSTDSGTVDTTVGPSTSSTTGASSGSSSDDGTSSSTGDPQPVCGNGITEEGEDCDSDDLPSDCIGLGYDEGTLVCTPDCEYDASGCVAYQCNNGILEPDEVCEDTDLAGQDCILQGFDSGPLGCLPDCSGFDTSACVVCGDDMAAGPEACDGADLIGESCTTQGFDFGSLTCLPDCSGFDTSACIDCGDDMIEAPEVCDGSNLAGEDCTTQGFDFGTLACLPSCLGFDTSDCVACGNDMLEGPEACDGIDLAGEDCVSQGFDNGPLACQLDCTGFDVTGCYLYAGPCCAEDAAPGCDDAGCSAAICATDPFCCEIQWDWMCADAAVLEPACLGVDPSCPDGSEVCGNDLAEPGEDCDGIDLAGQDCITQGFDGGTLACQLDCADFDDSGCVFYVGDCCMDNGSPGCNDATCAAAICAVTPSCCDMVWDATCAADAAAEPACAGVGLCPGGMYSGDCCADNGTPGCDDPGCTMAICGVDPFCCDVQWDGFCALAAQMEPACMGVGGSCP